MAARSRRNTSTIVISIVSALLFLGFAIMVAGSSTTTRVTENARSLHWVNATTASISAVRASVSQAVLFGFGSEQGFADAGAAAEAYDEAVASLTRAELWANAPGSAAEGSEIHTDLDAFLAIGRETLAALDEGGPQAADDLFAESLEPAWSALEIAMITRQQELVEAIGATEGFSGFLSAISRLGLMVLVPVAAILVYRRQARREQRETRIKLEAELTAEQEVGRMRGQFIAGVSHELRTPLTTVVGFSQLLMDGGLDPGTAREMVAGITGEAGELSRMVEDLLVASRPEGSEVPIRIEDCEIGEQVEAVVAPLLRLGHPVYVRVEPAVANGDPVRVRQIIRNLVSNAFRHGGPTVWVTGAIRGGEYLLVVADDGTGVGPEVSARLFEPYAHAGEMAVVSGSVGLGLSVARQLARQMEGEITYQRTGDWTQFVLSLPLAAASTAPGPNDLARAAAEAF